MCVRRAWRRTRAPKGVVALGRLLVGGGGRRTAHNPGPGQAGYLEPPAAPGQAYLLGLLAKIKCSICSYQLNLWYVAHGVTRV